MSTFLVRISGAWVVSEHRPERDARGPNRCESRSLRTYFDSMARRDVSRYVLAPTIRNFRDS